MIKKIRPEKIPYDKLMIALCRTPYHKHTRGCINYARKEGCPPNEPIDEIFDLSKDIYVIYTSYDVGEFAERMRKAHPEWKSAVYNVQKSKGYTSEIISRLKTRHPEWPEEYFPKDLNADSWISSRNWYNPRLWQESARKIHRKELENFSNKHPGMSINSFPEAHGINLTGLMHNLGIKLEWTWPPPHDVKNKSYIISIAGHKKGKN